MATKNITIETIHKTNGITFSDKKRITHKFIPDNPESKEYYYPDYLATGNMASQREFQKPLTFGVVLTGFTFGNYPDNMIVVPCRTHGMEEFIDGKLQVLYDNEIVLELQNGEDVRTREEY